MKKSILTCLLAIIVLSACSVENVDPPVPVTLTQIDLRLALGTAVTGTFTVELRNAAGSLPALWSTTVDASTLTPGPGSSWNTFFVASIQLTNSQKYRIYVIRSGVHGGNDTISWSSSDNGNDEYPLGRSSCASPDLMDFCFRTYNGVVVDQYMESAEYGYGISDTFYHWQEFVAGG